MYRAVLLALAVVLAGCGTTIEFIADTSVDGRGNVVRQTKLASSGTRALNDLTTRYALLPGGTWTVRDESMLDPLSGRQRPVRFREYTTDRRFSRGEPIAGDYSRRGYASDAAATNTITVSSSRWWLVDWYSYAETFRDVVTTDSFAEGVHGFYALLITAFAEQISLLPSGAVPVNVAIARLRARYDAPLERALRVVRNDCFASAKDADDCFELAQNNPDFADLFRLLDDDEALLRDLVSLFPPPAGIAPDAWIAIIESEVRYPASQRLERLADSPTFALLMEKLLGVHGFHLFESYPFKLSLRLPGEILSSNAQTDESGVLRWQIGSDEFVFGPYELHARSRVVHSDRIAVVGFATVLVLLCVLVARAQRRRWRGL